MSDGSVFEIEPRGADETASAYGLINKIIEETGKITDNLVKKGGSIFERLTGSPKELSAIEQVQKRYAGGLEKLQKRVADIRGEMQRTGDMDTWRELAKEAQKYDDKIGDVQGKLDKIDRAMKGMQDPFGDGGFGGGFGFGSPLSGAFRSLSQVTMLGSGGMGSEALGQLQEGINKLSEFSDTASQMRQELTGVVQIGKQAVGSFKSTGTGIKGVAGGLKNGFGGLMSMMGGPWGIAIGAATAGIGLFTSHLDKQAQKIERLAELHAELSRSTATAYADLQQALSSGDVASAVDMYIQKEQENQNILLQMQRARHDVDTAQAAVDLENATQRRIDTLVDSIALFGTAAESSLTKAKEHMKGLEDQLYVSGGTLLDMQKQLEAWGISSEHIDMVLEQRRKELEESQPHIQRLREAESELTQTRLQALESARRFEEELGNFIEQMEFDRSRELEDRLRADQQAANAHARELQEIEKDNNAAIKELRLTNRQDILDAEKTYLDDQSNLINAYNDQAAEVHSELAKALAELDTDTAERRQQIAQDYMESEIEALEDHNKALIKSDERYQKERQRRLEDLQDELLDAEAQNDVVAFIQAQKNAEKDLKRMQEDFEGERTESQQLFDEQRIERQQQLAQQLADIQVEGAERRAEMEAQAAATLETLKTTLDEELAAREVAYNEQLDELAASLKAQLKEQHESYKQSINQTRAAFKEQRKMEDEERAFQDKRRQEDYDRQIEQMQTAHDREIAEMENRETELLTVIESGGRRQIAEVTYQQLQIVAEYKRGAASAAQAIREQFALTASSFVPLAGGLQKASSTGGGKPAPVLSGGGGQPVPTITIPPAGGGGGMVGGTQVHVSVHDINLGGITPEQFDEGMNNLVVEVVRAIDDTQIAVRVPLT